MPVPRPLASDSPETTPQKNRRRPAIDEKLHRRHERVAIVPKWSESRKLIQKCEQSDGLKKELNDAEERSHQLAGKWSAIGGRAVIARISPMG